jgi:hypothetical protein
MEESRHAISEALARRWVRRDVTRDQDVMHLRLESSQAKKKSGHLVLVFRRDKPFTPSELYNIRAGTCFQLVPPGEVSIHRVVLGNVVSNRTEWSWGDDRTEEAGATLSLMVYDSLEYVASDGEWQVAPVTALVSMLRQFEACTQYAWKIPFLANLIGGEGPTHIRFDRDDASDADSDEEKKEEDQPKTIKTDAFFSLPTLNPTQELACETWLNSSRNTISLVQGPPGTGKTTLLVTIICRYLMQSVQTKTNQKRRLLVCAPTNKAVSVIASRFMSSLRRDAPYKFNTVLIGDQDKLVSDAQNDMPVDSDTRDIFVYTWAQAVVDELKAIRRQLDRSAGADEKLLSRVGWLSSKLSMSLQKPPTNYRILELSNRMEEATEQVAMLSVSSDPDVVLEAALFQNLVEVLVDVEKQVSSLDPFEVTREVLRTADVLFCTCASAGNVLMKTTGPVEDLIVDEAAASTEPELYVPFHLMPNRLLAVGDPLQLPATVFSRTAERLGLSKSLHERLMYDLKKEHIMLDIQYRMKPGISAFPCRQFYDDRLSNGGNVVSPLYQNDVSLLSGHPYIFVHTNGTEKQGITGSYCNAAEAYQVRDLLYSIRAASSGRGDWCSIDRVRVITFYQAQVSMIKRLLNQAGLGRVGVATVDSSQGCEADVVIVSFVRSAHQGDGRQAAGFLTDDRRLNVAITRAKYQLLCVGNAEGLRQLSSAPTLQALARDAYERGCVIDNSKENCIERARPAELPPFEKHRESKKRRKKDKF